MNVHTLIEIEPSHRVTCDVARPKLISSINAIGFTVWCQRCKRVEFIQWDDLPIDLLERIHATMGGLITLKAIHSS